MEFATIIALLLPLLGFVFLVSGYKILQKSVISWIGCLSVFISFLLFSTLTLNFVAKDLVEVPIPLFSWIDLPTLHLQFSLHLDTLSLLMTLIITGVGFLIHVYSIGYMENEEDYARYFACLNLFVFAMLLLVLAGNLTLLFFGWEGVGLASYLLIGFWFTKASAAKAATKAFVMNRIGDAGFLLGLLLTLYLFRTDDIQTISEQAKVLFSIGAPVMTVLTLLYFIGATGKSAQIPLYTWLPDAMEGPTPVSALIHAATMVTAGVYLIVRLHDLYLLAPDTLYLVGAVGGVTALVAALSALSQTDLKKVLAYSTISQLGFMFLALGTGAFYAAMFHLTAHAFIKALLFLSAGNVIHMLHVQEMDKMGGLKKILPVTHILFLIGALALAGMPPFAAFLSKDLILEEEFLIGYHTLFYIGLITAFLTGFYLFRAYSLTFLGSTSLKTSHEAYKVMLIPVTILAILSLFGSYLGFSLHQQTPLEHFLDESDIPISPLHPVPTGFHFSYVMIFSIAISLLGILLALFTYTRFRDRLGEPISSFRKSFYINELYEIFFVYPVKTFSYLISGFLEPKIFTGSLIATASGVKNSSLLLQKLQSGEIRSYAAWMAIGMVFLLVYIIF